MNLEKEIENLRSKLIVKEIAKPYNKRAKNIKVEVEFTRTRKVESKSGEVEDCTMSPECKCEDCKKETEFMNEGGAKR